MIRSTKLNLLGLAMFALAGCGGTATTSPTTSSPATLAIGIVVTPEQANVAPGTTLQLSAAVENADGRPVVWSIEEGAAGGSVTSTGLYTAPATAGTYTVVATIDAVGIASDTASTMSNGLAKGRSKVKVTPPISVTVSPSTATMTMGASATFTASVSNTTDQAVTWSVQEGSTGGIVTSAGVYTAPETAGTYHVVATSVADPTKSASSTVSVTAPVAPPPAIAVTVSPSSAALSVGGTVTFVAAVANTTNQAVTWSILEGSTGGMITSAGVYSAPSTAGAYHVVATSVADPAVSARATVTVTALAISVSVNPASATLTAGASLTFAATVANSSNQGVTWSIQEGANGGTISSAGVYTAPSTAGAYHVVATSVVDATRAGTATVTVTAPSAPPPAGGGLFEAPNAWNTAVDSAPMSARSAIIVNALNAAGGWGYGRMQIDFGLNILHADATTPYLDYVPGAYGAYTPDCDLGIKFPLPANGAIESESGYTCTTGGDCHLIVVDGARKQLYELYQANVTAGQVTGTCAVVWNLAKSYPPDLRGDQCTSTDAAGLPVAALLFTADEVAAGSIDHAIRFILPNARMAKGVFVRPATHAGAPSGGPDLPPYGSRLRLKASYPISTLPSEGARVIARAMQKYGIILADGGNVALTAADDRFTQHKWADVGITSMSMTALKVTDFEVVDTGPTIPLTYDCVRNGQ